MFNVDVSTNLGFIVGFLIADDEQRFLHGIKWGFSLQLGILSINLFQLDPDSELYGLEEDNDEEV